MTFSLRVEELEIRGFRNIGQLSLRLAPRVNVISGDNGHGKTSVLEALYLLATSRSFRTEKLTEVCQEGAQLTRVTGSFREGEQLRRQRAVLSAGRRSLFIDDKKPERLSSYAVRTPVVIFGPADLQLVSGGAATRRTLLDRVALFVDPATGDARARYAKAQKERQILLETKGEAAAELDVFEQLMAEHGSQIERSRAAAVSALEQALVTAFARMAAQDLRLKLQFVMGGSADPAAFLSALAQRRRQDRRRKAATFGPQKDDLELTLNGRSARRHASQGQQRVLTLALKAAELACVRDARGTQPILLLDDVSSELDPTRTGAVYDFIRETDSQVLVTTTRPELFETPGLEPGERQDFRLLRGEQIPAA
ncbi:MAG: hypothetical protein RJA70_3656 [Pseudomonadota bacterium]